MERKGREGLFSAEKVLRKLVEKDSLYEDYRKNMEEKGLPPEPMRYVNEKGRTVKADVSREAMMNRRNEYENLNKGKEMAAPVPERSRVSLDELTEEEKPLRKRQEQKELAPVREKKLQKGLER